jgi:Asp-tRNA(Asn)/Glu-tRNA(Gln) amidotransferase A subunit family amidase
LIGNLFGENANAQPTTYEKFATKNRTLFFDKEFKARLTLGSYLMNNDNFENIYLQACKFRS